MSNLATIRHEADPSTGTALVAPDTNLTVPHLTVIEGGLGVELDTSPQAFAHTYLNVACEGLAGLQFRGSATKAITKAAGLHIYDVVGLQHFGVHAAEDYLEEIDRLAELEGEEAPQRDRVAVELFTMMTGHISEVSPVTAQVGEERLGMSAGRSGVRIFDQLRSSNMRRVLGLIWTESETAVQRPDLRKMITGGDTGTRTLGLLHAMQAL